ncbi:divergent polysaccharide deacetylase family protein [Reinekea sp. G2M2-21]|uniref:divergent polysaccharide deacetylase family protein n=1 Tax=Reinekea sp. G2M2-21 TaxID=2788942 RepID=UPI0018A8967B|nr:divergent polysaccharide deacetylase family protein [Reinekea sp. G2M2-21]
MRTAEKTLLLWITVLLFSNTVFASGHGKLVLIVDDLGNQYRAGVDAIANPWITTVAIMPGRPYTRLLAEYANAQGKEVIIHSPMSNTTDFPLGELGLDRTQGREAMIENVRLSVADVPYAVGLSNHMGSRLTQDTVAMDWLMRELQLHQLFFFDSRTVSTTQAWKVAEKRQVPWAMRHYFLDHFKEPAFMQSQWNEAITRVQNGENITVICHPYPETLAFLNSLSLDENERNTLVPLSSVLNYPEPGKRSDRNIPKEPVLQGP